VKPSIALLFRLLISLLATAPLARAGAIRFAGHDWDVRSGQGGPGPNAWSEANVSVDAQGQLHLRVSHREGRWSCAEVTMRQRLGFGRYVFQTRGPIDRLDDNVVLGLFNYPTGDVGGDATNEIDLEFARWGAAKNPIGNFTVWPVEAALRQSTHPFAFTLTGETSTHRFDWDAAGVGFRSWAGLEADGKVLGEWRFAPADAAKRIGQRPMPVHLNLWLFQGKPPKDGREVEIVIPSFRFEGR